ncbi:MAG: DUF1659 domain-containing protein [Verrucomicrobia bacterium]|nr:DUF1659 domain-containing protein [Verrucomicrobiota bacterium]
MRLFLFLATALSLVAAPEPPPERKCTLRLAWWANPSERVELAIVQGKEIIPFVALEMNLDLSKEYRGPAQLVIVRKKGAAQKIEAFDPDKLYAQSATPKPDPKAKPEPVKKEKADDWAPFASLALPDSPDIGVLLLMAPDGSCAGRAFDYEAGRFPYGSIRVVNLSASTLAGEIDAKGFRLAPGSSDLLPVIFRERMTSHIKLAALLPNNGLEPILGTKIAGRPNRRSLVFVLQTGVSADGRPLFESRSIESVEPVAPVVVPPANGKPLIK